MMNYKNLGEQHNCFIFNQLKEASEGIFYDSTVATSSAALQLDKDTLCES